MSVPILWINIVRKHSVRARESRFFEHAYEITVRSKSRVQDSTYAATDCANRGVVRSHIIQKDERKRHVEESLKEDATGMYEHTHQDTHTRKFTHRHGLAGKKASKHTHRVQIISHTSSQRNSVRELLDGLLLGI